MSEIIHAAQAVLVQGSSNERLAQLHAQYLETKAQADEWAARAKGLSDAIKSELTQAAPDALKVELVTEGHRPLRLTYRESWRLNTSKLKAEDPQTYVAYAVKSSSWTLTAGGAGGESDG
jgi:hypothetical protein